MTDPEFCESQFQAATNLAYANEIRQLTGDLPFMFVPSLPAEFLLGWDTAFHFDWIPNRLSTRLAYHHKGCNFFLQYKLSSLSDTPNRSKEWAIWEKPYFRFQIPHRKKVGNKYHNDFHQWMRLKEIASVGVPTYYATNTMIEEHKLITLFKNGTLLDRVALLDIAPIKRKHIHVSFANPFTKFVLHSEPEEIHLLSFKNAIASFKDVSHYTYEEGVEQLTTIAEKLLDKEHLDNNAPGIREQLNQFRRLFLTYTGQRSGFPQFKRAILESFLVRRFGLLPHWYPDANSREI